MDNRISIVLQAVDQVTQPLARIVGKLSESTGEFSKVGSAARNALNGVGLSASSRSRVTSGLDTLKAKLAEISKPVAIKVGLALGAAQSQLAGLRDKLKQPIDLPTPGTSGMFGALLQANLVTQGITASIGLATSTLRSFQSTLLSAAASETSDIASASDLSATLKVSMPDATRITADLQGEIATIAASLPGMTADYGEIYNGISATVAELFAGDEAGFSAAITETVSRVGVLASIRQADAGQAASSVNKLLSGTAMATEVFANDIFQKNPLFIKAIREQAELAGVSLDDWKDTTAQQRLDIVNNALAIAAPDQMLKEFEGKTDSLIQGWMTSVFDPRKGLLGMRRAIEQLGGMTVLDTVQGLFTAINNLMSSLSNLPGIPNFDPMAALGSFIQWLTGVTSSLSGLVQSASSVSGVFDSLALGLASNLPNILSVVASGFNAIVASINTVLFDPALPKLIADGTWYAFGALGHLVSQLDWKAVVAGLMQVVVVTIQSLGSFVSSALKGIVQMFIDAIRNAVQGALSSIGSIVGLGSQPAVAQPQSLSDAVQYGNRSLLPLPNRPLAPVSNRLINNNTSSPVVNNSRSTTVNVSGQYQDRGQITSDVLRNLDNQYRERQQAAIGSR